LSGALRPLRKGKLCLGFVVAGVNVAQEVYQHHTRAVVHVQPRELEGILIICLDSSDEAWTTFNIPTIDLVFISTNIQVISYVSPHEILSVYYPIRCFPSSLYTV
jgi:hypothetical protein